MKSPIIVYVMHGWRILKRQKKYWIGQIDILYARFRAFVRVILGQGETLMKVESVVGNVSNEEDEDGQ